MVVGSAQALAEQKRLAMALEEQKRLAMVEMGIAVTEEELLLPQLVNMNEDPMKAGSIIYALKPGRTTVGKPDAGTPQNIKLIGLNMYALGIEG
ncbi:hypothetical protein T484DRAFT_1782033 [Baffinella frigidus]|nr:hypothetical protein T484DRAFT_1782033 [Cryptophyta sp. CCMP2293]